MSKIFSYNFEKYSPKDIIQFLNHEGFDVVYQDLLPGYREGGFIVKGCPIIVRYPYLKNIENPIFFELHSLAGDVKWENRKERYGLIDLKEIGINSSKELKEHKERYHLSEQDFFKPVEYKNHDKLFSKLKKKFQMKKGERAQLIKDLDWLQKIEKVGKLIF
jgi:hypothetical protein